MTFRNGDEVAFLKEPCAGPRDVVEITTIRYAGRFYIELHDGRMFSATGGRGLNTAGCIQPALEEYRLAVLERVQRTPEQSCKTPIAANANQTD